MSNIAYDSTVSKCDANSESDQSFGNFLIESDSSNRGLKYNFQGIFNITNLRKDGLSHFDRGLACFDGNYGTLALSLAPPLNHILLPIVVHLVLMCIMFSTLNVISRYDLM